MPDLSTLLPQLAPYILGGGGFWLAFQQWQKNTAAAKAWIDTELSAVRKEGWEKFEHSEKLRIDEAKHFHEEVQRLEGVFQTKYDALEKKYEESEREQAEVVAGLKNRLDIQGREIQEERMDRALFENQVANLLKYQSDNEKARTEIVADIEERQRRRRRTDTVEVLPPKKRILFVDDDQGTCDLMVLMLSRAEYEVEKSYNVSDALQHWTTARAIGRPFDMLILDYSMPLRSGDEIAAQVRLAGDSIPIAFFTGIADQGAAETLSQYTREIWKKPMAPGDLIAEVKRILA